MSRKLILTLCFAMLAASMVGCVFERKSTPAGRSTGDAYVAPTDPVSTPTSEPVVPPPPTPTSEPVVPPPPIPTVAPTATPEPTNTMEAPTPLPATETPLPPPPPESTGPVIAHFESGQSLTITSIRMLDAANGWAIGGWGEGSDHVLTSADGGQTWRDVTPPEPAPADGSLVALGSFVDARTGWVTYRYQYEMTIPARAVVWRTQDAGQTWQSSIPLDLTGLNEVYWPSDLVFADNLNGWLLAHVGAGMSHDYVALFRTQDGGQSWVRLIDPYGGSEIQVCQKDILVFPTAQNGWLTGDCGGVMAGAFLYQTTDGGQTWQSVNLPAPAEAPDLLSESSPGYCRTQSPVFTSPEAGKLIVRCLDTTQDPYLTSFYLYTTSDGGATWTPSSSPAGMLAFVTRDTGWALSRDLFHTTDGGQTWTKVKTVNWDGQFSFVSDMLGWAVARAETDAGTRLALVQTTDGGKTWDIIHPVIAP
jgi:photosystem II stability/assembly factor-like uncharacterized protein